MSGTGRTFFSWRGTIPSITITDPEQIKEVFNKVYDFPKPHTFPLTNLIISGLFSYDGDKWAKHRRIINPAFHLEKIKVWLYFFKSGVTFYVLYLTQNVTSVSMNRIWYLCSTRAATRLLTNGTRWFQTKGHPVRWTFGLGS